ncbi:hypothetical protein BDA96_02G156100 [Sorghum bicolor]|uniref:Uncharacterized protein n=1 Tax=Sorghum bicolor TaxID=4558 RepID=A0A921RMM7_SORBI|nr:hypothetical protein BDA96_02G156100 [Sorghum bicolor]
MLFFPLFFLLYFSVFHIYILYTYGISYLAFSTLVLLVKQMLYWFKISLPGTGKKVNKMEFMRQLPTMLSSIKSKTLNKLEARLQAQVVLLMA